MKPLVTVFSILLGLTLRLIGRIYRVGQIVEAFFVFFYRRALKPLGKALRRCTPRRIFNGICALGEHVIRLTVKGWRGISKVLIWAAHSLITDFSYWAPVLCAVGVFGLALFFHHYNVALEVSVGDHFITYASSEKAFTGAVLKAEKRISEMMGENYCMYKAPDYRFVLIARNEMPDEESLDATVYLAVTQEIGNHFGLYVDGTLTAAAEKRETIESVLNALKAPYETGAADERVEFVKNVEIRNGLFSPDRLMDRAQIAALFENSADPRYYTIQEDDYLEDIVEKTGLSKTMLYKLNPDLDDTRLVPGRKVLISQPDVYLGIKVVRTVTYEESISYATTREKDDTLYVGQTKVKVAGEKGVKSVTAEITYIDGERENTEILSSTVIKEPVTRVLYVGTKPYPSSYSSLAGTGAFIWPTDGGYVSCGFGGYGGHTGTDITMHGAYGQPVYASAGGTVIDAGYSGGYGNMVKIRHSNGYETWYAHMSAILVSVGEEVNQGQQIGRIGSTGNSTGPHLHFELRIDGTAVNAMRYL